MPKGKFFLFTTSLAVLTLVAHYSNGQTDTVNSPLRVSGYIDFYYAYDFNRPTSKDRGSMLNNSYHIYSHNRHNEMTLNHGAIFLKYHKSRVRGALSLHTGTYVHYNYAKEPDGLKNVYEAYAGYQFNKHLWVDAGIFPSHIGSESTISFDNYTLSRSIMADNTPYYESGIKATYSKSNKLSLTLLILNGWQNIIENNDNKAVGTQIIFYPKDNILINSSTFIGKEIAAYDTISTMRYFHNFFTEFIFPKFKIMASFDFGLQQKRVPKNMAFWYNGNVVLKYDIIRNIASAIRLEYYNDKNGIIINPGIQEGFQTFSPSLNFDYKINEILLWRIEGRIFRSKYPVYLKDGGLSHTNSFVLTAISVQLR